MQHESGRWLVFAVAVVVLAFSAFVIVLWSVGLFDFTGTDASAKIVSASLALVGGFFGSLVSIIGLILKHSLDQRNTDIREQAERRLDLESKRNSALEIEAENRLKLEAAIQAVSLLSTSTGKPAPMIQRVGALFALTSLKRYKLATALTAELLARGELDSHSAASILNRAMESGDRRTQEEAVVIFEYNVERFLAPKGAVDLPDSLFLWRADLSDYSREWGTIAMGHLLIARPLSEWNDSEARSILAALSLAWIKEVNKDLKQSIGAILNSVLTAIPANVVSHPLQEINIANIRSQVASATPMSDAVIALVREIDKWATEGSNPGS
jgi:hypothetical protein